MAVRSLQPLADFGVRSLVTHGIMVVTFLGVVGTAVFLDGQLQTVSLVAFINFTAGMWVCQAVHSLGNSFTDDDYQGVLRTVLEYVG